MTSKKTKTRSSARRPRPSAPPKRGARANTNEGPFARVWALVKRIPRGRVATYGQLSEMIDRRLTPVGIGWAIRAAGEDAIPWHRVINSKGTISTDGEHPGLQRAMLESEGVEFDAEGRVDLATACWRPRR
ncbi:MAG: MGMT family protein [Labilithrix sp.]|nr:MGMT family protein [Labilithrix sp.]